MLVCVHVLHNNTQDDRLDQDVTDKLYSTSPDNYFYSLEKTQEQVFSP